MLGAGAPLPGAKLFPLTAPQLTIEFTTFSIDTILLHILSKSNPLRKSFRIFCTHFRGRRHSDALPLDVCRFLAYKDKMDRSQPYRNGCPHIGQRGVFTCGCSRRLAYGTVDSYIGKLPSIFSKAGNQGEWNRSVH